VISDENFFTQLGSHHYEHASETFYYKSLEKASALEISRNHNLKFSKEILLGEFGNIIFPYYSMGAVNSSHLFGLDELIIFSFYYANRLRHKKILDLGANIGLHSLLLKKLGHQVLSYEPDDHHINRFAHIMSINGFDNHGLVHKAISDKAGKLEYVRILDNTTGSHLLGSKEKIYGPTEVVDVDVDNFYEVLEKFDPDFVKIDVEGHEVVLLRNLTREILGKTEIMMEIGSRENAIKIFDTLSREKIPAYSQKRNWNVIQQLDDLPKHHSEGSLFLSLQGPPIWK
jgi:FkbM family methyltransferase